MTQSFWHMGWDAVSVTSGTAAVSASSAQVSESAFYVMISTAIWDFKITFDKAIFVDPDMDLLVRDSSLLSYIHGDSVVWQMGWCEGPYKMCLEEADRGKIKITWADEEEDEGTFLTTVSDVPLSRREGNLDSLELERCVCVVVYPLFVESTRDLRWGCKWWPRGNGIRNMLVMTVMILIMITNN